jgi:hypothetical protein
VDIYIEIGLQLKHSLKGSEPFGCTNGFKHMKGWNKLSGIAEYSERDCELSSVCDDLYKLNA